MLYYALLEYKFWNYVSGLFFLLQTCCCISAGAWRSNSCLCLLRAFIMTDGWHFIPLLYNIMILTPCLSACVCTISVENWISDSTLSFPEALLINIFHHWMEADDFNMVIYRFWLAVLWLWRSKSTECDETTGLEEKEALMGLLAPWTVALLSSFCAPVLKIGLTGE